MKKIIVIATAILLTACTSVAKQNLKAQENISRTISFRLDCEPEKIEFKCLNINEHTEACNEYGIVACQEKSIYSQVGSSWIMTASKPL